LRRREPAARVGAEPREDGFKGGPSLYTKTEKGAVVTVRRKSQQRGGVKAREGRIGTNPEGITNRGGF